MITKSEITTQLTTKRLSVVPKVDLPMVLEDVMKVEREAWPEEIQASLEKFQSRAEVFPEGFLLVYSSDFGLVGVSTSEIIDYNPQDPPTSWEKVTDNGWIKETHHKGGNALYVVSVGVSPRASGQGGGTYLVKEQIKLAEQLNLRYLVLGSRLPGYAAYHETHPNITAQEYVETARDDNLPCDSEIRFYVRCGLRPVKIVANYMEDDPQSENYGMVMVWENKSQNNL